MSIESVMPSNHLILCQPVLFLPSVFSSIRVFSSESAPRIKWPQYWSFSFRVSPSNEHSGLISFRMDWLELRMWKKKTPRTLAPDSWDAYERNDFSEPRLLHLSIHRKGLNSLTWAIWFSLINGNLLIFRLPASCCKLLYNLIPPFHLQPSCLLGAVLSGLLERLSPKLEISKNSHQRKYNSQLPGCDYFFF